MKIISQLQGVAASLLAVTYAWSPLPSSNSTMVQMHMKDRAALITDDMKSRQDRVFRENLSPIAREAHIIVQKIRQDEIDHIWRGNATSGDEMDERFAGESFSRARPFISQTKLWKIIQRMPKGALLHAHVGALLSSEDILDAAMQIKGMSISASQSVVDAESFKNATISFSYNATAILNNSSIDSPTYVANTPIPVTIAANNFNGGRDAFFRFVKSKMTISPLDSVRHELGVDNAWRHIQPLFGVYGSALSYEPMVRAFYRRIFERLAEDGIRWVEVRCGAAQGDDGGVIRDPQSNLGPSTESTWWEILQDEIAKFQQTDKGRQFWGARVIWSDFRKRDQAALVNGMKKALEFKVKFPKLFSGYDLVGQEDLGRTLVEAAPELLWFQKEAQILNVSMPFFFHAGETLGDGNSTDLNLVDALVLRSRRVGHGFSLYKHPELTKRFVEQDVMVEVCPISNEVFRMTDDILHHPLPAMIAHGVPTAISNDDPSMLGQDTSGLSYDFYQVIQAFDNIGLAGLGALAQNSIRWAQFEDQSDNRWLEDIRAGEAGKGIKAQRIREWNRDWEAFCTWIVAEFK